MPSALANQGPTLVKLAHPRIKDRKSKMITTDPGTLTALMTLTAFITGLTIWWQSTKSKRR